MVPKVSIEKVTEMALQLVKDQLTLSAMSKRYDIPVQSLSRYFTRDLSKANPKLASQVIEVVALNTTGAGKITDELIIEIATDIVENGISVKLASKKNGLDRKNLFKALHNRLPSINPELSQKTENQIALLKTTQKGYTNEDKIQMAKYLVENKASINQLAEKYEINNSYCRYILLNELPKLNSELADQVIQVIESNKNDNYGYDDNTLIEMAQYYLQDGISTIDVGKKYKINPSSMYIKFRLRLPQINESLSKEVRQKLSANNFQRKAFSDQDIIEMANYMINNETTMKDVARKYKIHPSSAKYNLTQKLPKIDQILADQVLELIKQNTKHPEKVYDYTKTIEIADYIILNNASLNDAAQYFSLSPSRIRYHMNVNLKKADPFKVETVKLIIKAHQNPPVGYQNEDVVKMASYLIENKSSVRAVAQIFKISQTNLRWLLSVKLVEIDPKLAERVQKQINANTSTKLN